MGTRADFYVGTGEHVEFDDLTPETLVLLLASTDAGRTLLRRAGAVPQRLVNTARRFTLAEGESDG